MRKSGKKALIQLIRGAGTPFDISGVDSDGRARANAFSFAIEGNVVEGMGYNEDYVESIPTGQSTVSADITTFYNAVSNEVNDFLWTMYEETHQVADCADRQEYTLVIMPEGDCSGKERWEFSWAVIGSFNVEIPFDELMTVQAPFTGWAATRSIIV